MEKIKEKALILFLLMQSVNAYVGISEHTDFNVNQNELYLTLTDYSGKDSYVTVFFDSDRNWFTDNIVFEKSLIRENREFEIEGYDFTYVGKYANKECDISLNNSEEYNCAYKDSLNRIMKCDKLDNKDCYQLQYKVKDSYQREDYYPVFYNTIIRENNYEFHNVFIPANSIVQLKFIVSHNLYAGEFSLTRRENKFNISVCQESNCFKIDPLWWNNSWLEYRRINISNPSPYECCKSIQKIDTSYVKDKPSVRIIRNISGHYDLMPYEWYNASRDALFIILNDTCIDANGYNDDYYIYYNNTLIDDDMNTSLFFFRDDFEKKKGKHWTETTVEINYTYNETKVREGVYSLKICNNIVGAAGDEVYHNVSTQEDNFYAVGYFAKDIVGTKSYQFIQFELVADDDVNCYAPCEWRIGYPGGSQCFGYYKAGASVPYPNRKWTDKWFVQKWFIDVAGFTGDWWINGTESSHIILPTGNPVSISAISNYGADEVNCIYYDYIFLSNYNCSLCYNMSVVTLGTPVISTTTTSTTTSTTIAGFDTVDIYYFDNTLNRPHDVCIGFISTSGLNWRLQDCYNVFKLNRPNNTVVLYGNGSYAFSYVIAEKVFESTNFLTSVNLLYAGISIFCFFILVGMIIWLKS